MVANKSKRSIYNSIFYKKDWKRFRNLRVPENHPCCAYMDSELVSLLLTRTNMTWMLIPVDGFQGCSSKFSDLLYG